ARSGTYREGRQPGTPSPVPTGARSERVTSTAGPRDCQGYGPGAPARQVGDAARAPSGAAAAGGWPPRVSPVRIDLHIARPMIRILASRDEIRDDRQAAPRLPVAVPVAEPKTFDGRPGQLSHPASNSRRVPRWHPHPRAGTSG